MNAEFQRIAKRDNKAFLSQQMQREENNRMGKARNLFKKIKDSQGTVYAKIGTSSRNGKDLTEADNIKRWQEYTEGLYEKGLYDPDKHDGVVTQLEPECEV